VNDILDVSKIESGKLEVENIELGLVNCVRQVALMMKPIADVKGIDFTVAFVSSVPSVIWTDPTRLRQILVNLVSNAIKFTREGGVTINVSYEEANQQVAFEVIDSGVGMNAEQLAKIRRFEAFMQADTSMTRRFGGTGLGLRISNALIVKLGGERLAVESEPERGSRFQFAIKANYPTGHTAEMIQVGDDLYLDATVSRTEASKPAADLSILQGARILLAEDGLDNQRLVSFLLKKVGAMIRVVENGQEALEALGDGSGFDLVLMDMQMPIMDGYTAARRLRDTGLGLPVIALTAHAMVGDKEKCLAAGCCDHIAKPIDRQSFLAVCAQWLHASQSHRARA